MAQIFYLVNLQIMIKKKAKDMIGTRKLQRAKKAWNKGRKIVLILLVKCYRYKMKQKHHTYWKQEQAKTTGASQNNPKPAKRTQIQLKWPKTSKNNTLKMLNNPKQPNILKLEIQIFY